MPYDMLKWPELRNQCNYCVDLSLIDIDFDQENGHGYKSLLLVQQDPFLQDLKERIIIHTIGLESRQSESLAKAVRTIADTYGGVICISLGTYTDNDELRNTIDYATSKGCLIIAAAGNEASESPFYPAAYDNSIAVTSVDNEKHELIMNNHGDWIDISLPGEDLRIINGQRTETLTGSSGSTILMACITAVLKCIDNDMIRTPKVFCSGVICKQ